MKTAVSLPDDLFAEAEHMAKRLGLSRSELYARAIAAFVREHSGATVTEAINRALRASSDHALDPILARMQAVSIGPDEGSYEDWVEVPSRRRSKASEPRRAPRKRGPHG